MNQTPPNIDQDKLKRDFCKDNFDLSFGRIFDRLSNSIDQLIDITKRRDKNNWWSGNDNNQSNFNQKR